MSEKQVTLLLSIPNVAVSQIYEGESVPLARATLELSLIPAEPDHFLVLKVAEVEVALNSETRVFKKGDTGFFVPWIELPGAILAFDLSACDREYIESLDTYLVDLTSMPAPDPTLRNQLALVDSEGQVIGGVAIQNAGELSEEVLNDDRGNYSNKAPVYVGVSADGAVKVEEWQQQQQQQQRQQKDSKIVRGSDYVSHGILYTADALSSGMQRGSSWLNARSPATTTDVEFHPAARASTRKIHQFSTGVSHVSNKTFGYVAQLAEKAGGRVARTRKAKVPSTGTNHDEDHDEEDDEAQGSRPGLLAHAAYALVTVLDAVDAGGKQVLESASSSVGRVVTHRYGSQAGTMANELGGAARNVALVYFDARGVSHKALLKNGVKGVIKARGAGTGTAAGKQREVLVQVGNAKKEA